MSGKHYLPLTVAAVALVAAGSLALGGTFNPSTSDTATVQSAADNVDASSGQTVWFTVERGPNAPETAEDQSWKVENLLMEGEEAIEEQIKSGSSASWDTIALGQGAAPTDSSGTLDQEYTGSGLSPATATIEDVGDGNWNLTHTFTASADGLDVNTTAQKSTDIGNTAIDYFAGASFSTRTLYSGDDLTVEWENTVS